MPQSTVRGTFRACFGSGFIGLAFLLPGNLFAAAGGYIVSVAGKLAAVAVFIAAVGGKQKHDDAGEKSPSFGGVTCN